MKARHVFIVLWLVFGLGVWLGHRHEQATHHAVVEKLKREQATAQLAAAEAATLRLQQAQQRGDELTLQVAEQARQVNALTKEKRDALRNATYGRACLGTAALRVLDSAPGLRVAGLPEAAGSVAAADGPVATDSDIGQWSVDAGAQYELCRGRLGALIQWHREPRP